MKTTTCTHEALEFLGSQAIDKRREIRRALKGIAGIELAVEDADAQMCRLEPICEDLYVTFNLSADALYVISIGRLADLPTPAQARIEHSKSQGEQKTCDDAPAPEEPYGGPFTAELFGGSKAVVRPEIYRSQATIANLEKRLTAEVCERIFLTCGGAEKPTPIALHDLDILSPPDAKERRPLSPNKAVAILVALEAMRKEICVSVEICAKRSDFTFYSFPYVAPSSKKYGVREARLLTKIHLKK